MSNHTWIHKAASRVAIILAAATVIGSSPAYADHDDYDHGEHRGWYHHHHHDYYGPGVVYGEPVPVYAYPEPVYEEPPPVVVYPPTGLNIVIPVHIH